MEKGHHLVYLVHLVGIVQSLGLFIVVCLATAALLSLAMVALARMERATVPVHSPSRPPRRPDPSEQASLTTRVSSAGSCTYGPPGR
jgi:hypothetical protein